MTDDQQPREYVPMEARRKFVATVGTAAAAGLSGCVFGGGSGDGNSGDGGGGDGSGDNTDGGGGDGSGDGNSGDGTDGSSGDGTDGGGGDGSTTPVADNPLMPEDRKQFLASGGTAETTFDADLSTDTVFVGGDSMDAVVDADVENHRYTVDEDALGSQLSEGSVLLVSGVSLRKVTSVDRNGSEATVETERAALNEAIESGRLEWDADVGFDVAHSPDSDARSTGRLPVDGAGSLPGEGPGDRGMYFAGVEMVHDDRTEAVPAGDVEVTGPGLKWTYEQGGLEYIFELSTGQEQATVSVTVQKVVAGGNAKLALSAEGTVGRLKSKGTAEYDGGELKNLDMKQDNLSGELTVEIAAAGSASGSINWEFPGFMFKYVVPIGPVPVTVGIEAKLIGKYQIPVKGSATAKAEFSYDGRTGISYDGTSADVDATMGNEQIKPEPADSAANIGDAVDLQFGLAFPRLELSFFDQGVIPFVHAGTTIGSRLTWGPLCKSSYVRFVVQAGYDLSVLGVNLASDKKTLYENKQEAKGDSCKD